MKKSLCALIASVAGYGLLGPGVGDANAQPSGPSITVSPQSAAPGGGIGVQGTGFAANTCGVELSLENGLPAVSLGQLGVSNGAFSGQAMIPAGTAAGSYKVVARGLFFGGEFCVNRSGESAQADLRVQGRPQPVERLTIEFVDPNDNDNSNPNRALGTNNFRLLSRQDVLMVLPPADLLPATPNGGLPSGFWYELVAADGSVRYRRIIHNPVFLTFEGPDIDTGGMVPDRKEAIPQSRIFSLLVPNPLSGDSLVLFSSPLTLDGHGRAASEVGRILLTDPIP